MRGVLSLLVAVAVCLTAWSLANPAQAGIRDRRAGDAGQASGGQCQGEKCQGNKCGHRRPIDVNVDVQPAPVTVVPEPAKPAVKPNAGEGEKTALLGLLFVGSVLAAAGYLFHQRVQSGGGKN